MNSAVIFLVTSIFLYRYVAAPGPKSKWSPSFPVYMPPFEINVEKWREEYRDKPWWDCRPTEFTQLFEAWKFKKGDSVKLDEGLTILTRKMRPYRERFFTLGAPFYGETKFNPPQAKDLFKITDKVFLVLQQDLLEWVETYNYTFNKIEFEMRCVESIFFMLRAPNMLYDWIIVPKPVVIKLDFNHSRPSFVKGRSHHLKISEDKAKLSKSNSKRLRGAVLGEEYENLEFSAAIYHAWLDQSTKNWTSGHVQDVHGKKWWAIPIHPEIKATDLCRYNVNLTYHFPVASQTEGMFRIQTNSNLGESPTIYFDGSIRDGDRDYFILIQATRAIEKHCYSTAVIRIHMVNANLPKFTKKHYYVEIVDITDIHTEILTLYAHPNATYELNSKNGASVEDFELLRLSGNLRTTKLLDANRTNIYNLQAKAIVGENVGKTDITITVLKTNSRNPVFEKNEYFFQLDGPIVQTDVKIGQVKATTQTGQISYIIQHHKDHFLIDDNTGEIFTRQNLLEGTYGQWKIGVLACNEKMPEFNEDKRCTDVCVTLQVGNPPPTSTDYPSYDAIKMQKKTKRSKIPGLSVLGCIVGAIAVGIVVELTLLLPGSLPLTYMASELNLLTPPPTPNPVPPPTPNPVTVPVSPNASSIQQVPE